MKRFFFLFALLAIVFSHGATLAAEFTGRVIRVSDGDTLTVETPAGEKKKIRLYGVDCPESKQAGGVKATNFTRNMVFHQQVYVFAHEKDRYERIVGEVYLDKKRASLNEALIMEGLAWVYPQYCKQPICRDWQKIETIARQNKKGIWADDAEAPWEWRRKNK